MGDEETITVADVSEGEGVGDPVELPVVEVLTGRSFLTGKSGAGKSNTASVVAEKLLDEGFGLMIVDIEGEYYGLKEEYEILHAGADEECDIQVSPEHADKLATLALEENVPIILDVSGFLHEEDARELVTAVARRLFAMEKKCKQPFLLVVEEVHEFLPEGAGLDECGRMLIKVAKRGRKHGLGVAGISQRPADVKKDFITQCDWLVWHRLTWKNDTKVVQRVLGSEYADEVTELGDGEAFLMADWDESLRRVQFRRKQTFDAGATPGLEDVERPDLKSVSGDLVSELQAISEEQAKREDDIARLENELEEREQRIAELKDELARARDLSDVAEQFARAMTDHADAVSRPLPRTEGPEFPENGRGTTATNGAGEPTSKGDSESDATGAGNGPNGTEPVGTAGDGTRADASGDSDGGWARRDVLPPEQRAIVQDAAAAANEPVVEPDPKGGLRTPSGAGEAERATSNDPVTIQASDGVSGADESAEDEVTTLPVDAEELAERLREGAVDLDERARRMLAAYREAGIATPEAVHEAIGGSGERAAAYGHNRTLRKHGFVVHVGGGHYAYAVPSLLEALGEDVDDDRREALLATVEEPL